MQAQHNVSLYLTHKAFLTVQTHSRARTLIMSPVHRAAVCVHPSINMCTNINVLVNTIVCADPWTAEALSFVISNLYDKSYIRCLEKSI